MRRCTRGSDRAVQILEAALAKGADTIDGSPSTSLGLGAILQLQPPFRLLGSAGPTFVDGDDAPGFHAFLALGLDF